MIGTPDGKTNIRIDFILSGREEWRIKPQKNNFRLNCVAAINLFPWSAEPIRYDESRPYHRIVPNRGADKHYAPHNALKVRGMRLDTSKVYDYPSFLSYKHARGREEESAYYHLKRREGVDGRPELLLGIVRPDVPGPEIISTDLMSGNDHVVGEVNLGEIAKPYKNLPDFIMPKNLTVPRTPAWPDFKGGQLWELVNSLSLNYMSIASPDRFRNMLSLFDRTRSRSNERRIAGVDSLGLGSIEKLIKGCPVRVMTMDMALKRERFTNRGDMFMFSGVMSGIMSMYAPINSFCRLRVKEVDAEEVYEWPIRGEQAFV